MYLMMHTVLNHLRIFKFIYIYNKIINIIFSQTIVRCWIPIKINKNLITQYYYKNIVFIALILGE